MYVHCSDTHRHTHQNLHTDRQTYTRTVCTKLPYARTARTHRPGSHSRLCARRHLVASRPLYAKPLRAAACISHFSNIADVCVSHFSNILRHFIGLFSFRKFRNLLYLVYLICSHFSNFGI